MKVRFEKPSPNVVARIFCGDCGKELPIKYFTDEKGVPCVNPRVTEWNFCPNCGAKVEKEGEYFVSQ